MRPSRLLTYLSNDRPPSIAMVVPARHDGRPLSMTHIIMVGTRHGARGGGGGHGYKEAAASVRPTDSQCVCMNAASRQGGSVDLNLV